MNIDVIKRRVLASEPPQKYLLDEFPGASFAFSFRRLRRDYNGPVIELVKSGNIYQDIFFKDDYVDVDAIFDFAQGAQTTSARFYDQSVNLRLTNRATFGNGFVITQTGNVFPRVFNGKAYFQQTGFQHHNISAGGLPLNNFSIFSPYSKTAAGNQLAIAGGTGQFIIRSFNNSNFEVGLGANIVTFPFSQPTFNVPRLATFIKKGENAEDILFFNNGQEILGSGNGFGSVNMNFLFNSNPTANLGSFKHFPEIIIYPTDQSSNREAIEQNINAYYNIF